MTPEEWIARGIAPVKAQYLRPAAPAEAAPTAAPAAAEPQEAPEGGAGGGGGGGSLGGAKLSKKQEARARAAGRAQQLCHAFTAGRCTLAAGACRFSHDAAAFLANKPADLPGLCPFAVTGACPYGLACRYAGTHAAAPPAVAAPPALPDVAAALANAAASLPLPPVAAVEAERNATTRELITALRRNVQSFPAADAHLNALGLKISFKPARGSGKDAQGGDATAAEVPPVADGADGGAAAAAEVDNDGDASAPDAKRQRTEPASAPAAAPGAADDGVRGALAARLRPGERKLVDFRRALYLAPLTTVGNLPFRRLCKSLGADITCSEMALASNLLQGNASEWALLRRHPCEDIFGVQVCGGFPDALARTAELLAKHVECDFVDINMGCPIDLVVNKGAGSALLLKPARIESISRAVAPLLRCPLTLKTRTGYADDVAARVAHTLAPQLSAWGVSALTLHGRSRAQRYSRTADWDYIGQVRAAAAATPLQLIGNGDVMGWSDYESHLEAHGVATCMIARGALLKPWIFTEIKERRDWDIRSGERFALLQRFASHGLEHWGSDAKGVETTRRFLLEWLSFLHRYIPVGLLERLPQRLNHQPPAFVGRDELETLMGSPAGGDWLRITTMLLGPTPEGFRFAPKHKSNAYAAGSEAAAAHCDAHCNG